jgi:hypothetical protein
MWRAGTSFAAHERSSIQPRAGTGLIVAGFIEPERRRLRPPRVGDRSRC